MVLKPETPPNADKMMSPELFAELLASVREGGAILRGEQLPSRLFTPDAPPSPDASAPDVNQSETPPGQ